LIRRRKAGLEAADTTVLEQEIYQRVYKLYVLTLDEIAVVEGGGSRE